MWHFRLWDVQDVAVFLSVTLFMCQLAGGVSIQPVQRSLTRSVQQDVLFSLDVGCNGTATVEWTFMSAAAASRSIGTWQPGGFTNITRDYSSRVQPYANGSMGLSALRLQDAGFYVVTVTEGDGGRSRDVGFVLKVNEVLYEDLHYLFIAALSLGCLAALLMAAMWLLDKACAKVEAWRHKTRVSGNDETELQNLN